jgi:hypothetical protein
MAEFNQMIVDAVPLESQRQKILEELGAIGIGGIPPSQGSEVTQPLDTGGTRESVLNDNELRKAEEQLATFLGPLAKLLVKRMAKRTTNRHHFYQLLAGELATLEEREAFLEAVRNQD